MQILTQIQKILSKFKHSVLNTLCYAIDIGIKIDKRNKISHSDISYIKSFTKWDKISYEFSNYTSNYDDIRATKNGIDIDALPTQLYFIFSKKRFKYYLNVSQKNCIYGPLFNKTSSYKLSDLLSYIELFHPYINKTSSDPHLVNIEEKLLYFIEKNRYTSSVHFLNTQSLIIKVKLHKQGEIEVLPKIVIDRLYDEINKIEKEGYKLYNMNISFDEINLSFRPPNDN